jgi:hypothetical protein
VAAPRKRGKTDLDVTGFLSVMSIVTGLIALILFTVALRIAINPKALRIISFKLFTSIRAATTNPKVPSYVDCHPDHITLYPGEQTLSWEDMQRPGNPLQQMLDRILNVADKEYVIVMVRPGSAKLYRAVRNEIGKRRIDVGYDAIPADFKVDWNAAKKALGIVEE